MLQPLWVCTTSNEDFPGPCWSAEAPTFGCIATTERFSKASEFRSIPCSICHFTTLIEDNTIGMISNCGYHEEYSVEDVVVVESLHYMAVCQSAVIRRQRSPRSTSIPLRLYPRGRIARRADVGWRGRAGQGNWVFNSSLGELIGWLDPEATLIPHADEVVFPRRGNAFVLAVRHRRYWSSRSYVSSRTLAAVVSSSFGLRDRSCGQKVREPVTPRMQSGERARCCICLSSGPTESPSSFPSPTEMSGRNTIPSRPRRGKTTSSARRSALSASVASGWSRQPTYCLRSQDFNALGRLVNFIQNLHRCSIAGNNWCGIGGTPWLTNVVANSSSSLLY